MPLFDIHDERLATAAWSRICEPSDRAARTIIDAVGASEALAWCLGALGGKSLKAPAYLGPGVSTALARWAPRMEYLDPLRDITLLRRLGGRLIIPSDHDWPSSLNDLGAAAPLCLWVRGNPDVLTGLKTSRSGSLSVVGTRVPSPYGRDLTHRLVAEACGEGWTILSGGAFGIDAAAHRAALLQESPTVAVMAGGIDRLYPRGNAELLEEIAEQGLVISELPPGSAPRRERFLSRNRIIAALGGATIVTEAGWRSGSQNTARRAAELLRSVGAVPGPVTSAASAGCHRLIREGVATLVTDMEDIRELLGPLLPEARDESSAAVNGCSGGSWGMSGRRDPDGGSPGLLDGLSSAQRRVLDAMPRRGSIDSERLAAASGLSVPETTTALGSLELSGKVTPELGGYRRASPRSGRG